MTFNAIESSPESGSPLELFLFRGSETYSFTSGNESFTYGGNVYEPTAISRTAIQLNGKESSGNLTITMPFNNPFAARYSSSIPPSPETLDIYQVHLTDPDLEVVSLWEGVVSSVKISGTDAKIAVKTAISQTANQIPKRTFGWACDHVLYGNLCGVERGSFEIRVRVTGIDADRTRLTFVDLDTEGTNNYATKIAGDANYYQGGFITSTYAADARMITKTGTDTGDFFMDLMVPLDRVEVGDVISVFSGCDRSVQTCNTKFSNVANYGGFPFIPTSNPFAVGIQREDEGEI